MDEAASQPSPRRFSIAQLALLVPGTALVIDAWGPIRDNSFLWHVRAGELQANAVEVLTADPFSFTEGGTRWLTQSWLVELLYSWLEGWSGLGFVPWMILVVSSMVFIGVALIAYRHSQSVTAVVFVLVLTTIALLSFLVPRPVLFSYLLLVLVVLAWERPSCRWSVPLLFWIWAAVHASFVIGLAYIGIRIIMRRDWQLWLTAMVSGLATLATAHGLGVAEFLVQFGATSDALEYITEWRKPGLFDPLFLPILGGVVFIVIGAFRGLVRPIHLWLVVPFLLLSMTAVRAIPPAWLALVPVVSLALTGLSIGTKRSFSNRLAVIFAVAVFTIPLLLIEESVIDEDRFPVAALPSLNEAPTFHDDRSGGFLIWAEGPDRQVYIDDRAELYGQRLGEFVRVRRGEEDWQAVFERDGVEQALLANSDESLIEDIESGGWSIVYADSNFTILRP